MSSGLSDIIWSTADKGVAVEPKDFSCVNRHLRNIKCAEGHSRVAICHRYGRNVYIYDMGVLGSKTHKPKCLLIVGKSNYLHSINEKDQCIGCNFVWNICSVQNDWHYATLRHFPLYLLSLRCWIKFGFEVISACKCPSLSTAAHPNWRQKATNAFESGNKRCAMASNILVTFWH